MKTNKVKLLIPTGFGLVQIEFTVLHVTYEKYLMVAQDRIVIGKKIENRKWILSNPIDLFDMPLLAYPQYLEIDGKAPNEL